MLRSSQAGRSATQQDPAVVSLPTSVSPDAASRNRQRLLRAIELVAVVLTLAFVVQRAFLPGWKQGGSDFPNYYTAAVLLRQHQPLRNYYDWTWFARQMNYAGMENQLGGYSPQTPLTMLPFVPLAGFPPQRARRLWLMANVCFLGAAIWLLSRITRFRAVELWLLASCAYYSLRANFLLGQYYLFLLFLLALAFYLLHRRNYVAGGLITGTAFALKLYGGPFLLYFVARREWKALAGMILAAAFLGGVALAWFGYSDVHFYTTQILPRTLDAAAIDPYSDGLPTVSNLLRRLLVPEPELNPHPVWNAPWLFFFLRTFVSCVVALLLVWQTSRRQSTDKQDFAWFMIGILLLSTNASSYTFILLLLPVVLLLDEEPPRSPRAVALVLGYVLLALPLRPAWLFPKVWMLLALFVCAGWPRLRLMSLRVAAALTLCALALAIPDARRQLHEYAEEPGQRFERVAVERGAVFSSFPVVTHAGLFYQSIDTRKGRYVLRWLHEGRNDEVAFDGQALQPRATRDSEAVEFELVAHGKSTRMRFDATTGEAAQEASPAVAGAEVSHSAASPDGKWLAYESAQDGPEHLWLRNLATGEARRLTGGNCNSFSPAWELDSRGVVFASDCGRGLGLPALYRAVANEK